MVLTLPRKFTATLFDWPIFAIHSRIAETAISRPMITTAMIAFTRSSRSEEHTSELQSRLHLVCRLLLEKKKKKKKTITNISTNRNNRNKTCYHSAETAGAAKR